MVEDQKSVQESSATHSVNSSGKDQKSINPVAGDLSSLKAQANTAQNDNRYDVAQRLWQEILKIEEQEGEALCGIAICLISASKGDEAKTYINRVLASNVIHYAPCLNLASKLRDSHRYDDSIAVYRHLIRGYPNQGDVWHNLGLSQLGARRAADALASLRRASKFMPTTCAVWCNIVLALLALDRLPEALAMSRRALAIEPASPTATFNMAAVLLAMGRLREGFAAYEYRFALPGAGWFRRDVKAPPWTGEPLAGRSILVAGEQANGDQLQFSRYIVELSRRGAKVTYVLPKRLHQLLRSVGNDVALIEAPNVGDHYDFQVPLLSLPHHCGIEDNRVPSVVPYLSAEPERVAAWQRRLGSHGFRVGVAWQGNRYAGGNDLGRSFPLDALWPLAQVPGVRLISLQLSEGLDQLSQLPPGMSVETLGEDYDIGEHAFLDAAAVLMNLDLVVTLDSAMAHLAGALARPTWLALPFAPEWRWQRERTNSPWYPTMRLFRQGVLGDWDGVFQRMAEALVSLVSSEGSQLTSRSSPDLPLVPASFGEVMDKISILEIKVERLQPASAAAANFELTLLRSTLDGFGDLDEAVVVQFDELRRVNRSLWDVEDRLRIHEAEQIFDAEFISLARSVYTLNDDRAHIKRFINEKLGSAIIEQKSYGQSAVATSVVMNT